MNWRQAVDTHGISIEDLKEQLPLDWVVGVAAEIDLEPDGDGRVKGLCPFHEDENPSLDVYGYGARWGCFACGAGGDLYDFIGSYWELSSFGAQFERGIKLLSDFGSDEWDGVATNTEPAAVVDQAVVDAEVTWARGNTKHIAYPISQLLQSKGLEIPESWLMETWGLGVDENFDVVAPYYASDGVITSYKTRTPGRGGWYARKGRQLTTLYGEHLLGDAPNVWLTEGETDTWLASYLLRGRGVALGLPSGAAAQIRPEWIDLVKGRNVRLVFDADVAGRRAALRWYAALNGVAAEIHISFPEGDLCESPRPDLVLDSGLTVNTTTGYVMERVDRGAYLQVTRAGAPGDTINNWILEPTRFISYLALDGREDQRGFEGYFTNDKNKKRLIKNTDLKNSSSAVDWSNLNDRVWFASGSRWTQAVLDELNAKAPFLSRVMAVAMVGLHGVDEGRPVFVLPEASGGVIGSAIAAERWMANEEGTSSDYGDQYKIPPVDMTQAEITEWGIKVVQALMSLNKPDIVTPIIAWLCAATLRSLVAEFPPLGVMGGSGSGKTTMLKWMLWTFFGIKEEHNLSAQSTPYGLTGWAIGTNCLPVWYDEYRRSAKVENLAAVDQMIRDAWTASASSRGGMGDDKTKIRDIRITAPLIISGESAFSETSHIDRMVIIQMPDKNSPGMDSDALEALMGGMEQKGRLGRLYMEWVIWRLEADTLPVCEIVLDRQKQGEAVLEWGWHLWCEFALEALGLNVNRDGLDLGNVRSERLDADEHPVLTALGECIERGAQDQEGRPLAWVHKESIGSMKSVVAVRFLKFHKWAEREGYPLPGNAKGTAQWLKQRFTVVKSDGRVEYRDPLGNRKQLQGGYLIGVLEAAQADINRKTQV